MMASTIGSSAYSGGEGVELAEESAGEGDSDERHEEEDQQAAEQRRTVDQSLVVLDQRSLVVVAACERDHGEDSHVHRGVGGGVETGCRNAAGSECRKGSKQIAGVRDRGIRQHALHVLLAQRGQIADGHRENSDDPENRVTRPREASGTFRTRCAAEMRMLPPWVPST